MSSFFRPEVAPMFEKPQKSLAEGGSAAGGVGGSANAGSTSRLAEPETILVDDYDSGVGRDVTADDDATESEPEASSEPQQLSTDTEHTSLSLQFNPVDVKLLLLKQPWLDQQLVLLLSGLQGLESIVQSPVRAVHCLHLHSEDVGRRGAVGGKFAPTPGG
eukprot:1152739-Rhodomonas_salina.1